MKTLRLSFVLALLAFSPFAFPQAPVCDVTCAPDPGGSGYDTTVDALTKVQNMRGTQTIYAPETAGSAVTYHATGIGTNQAQGKIVAGSSSYSYSIPILNLPGRNGLDLNLTLYYNSRIWNANSDSGVMTFNADRDFPGYGFHLGYGFIESNSAHSSFTLAEGDGTKRKLTGGTNSTYSSTDTSFIQFVSTTNILTYKNGTRVFYQQFPNNQTTLYRPTQIEDTNGNFISISYRTDTWVQGQEIDTITDTLGRQIVFSYDPTTHELIGIAQGAQQYVSLAWNNNYTLKYNFSGWLVQNSPANNSIQKVLTGVTYAGNSAGYLFTYGDWGIIKTIQFGPSSGSVIRNSVSYNYPPGTTAQGGGPWFSQQTVFDGVNTNIWQYSMTSTSSAITDPYGTKTTTNFDFNTGFSKSIVITSGTTTLRTITNTWNSGSNPTIASTTMTLGDTSQQSQTTFSYDTYKNVTEIKEYDFGLVYKRRTHTDYLADTNYVTAHVLNRPTSVYVYDESGTETLKQRTDVAYDENPTTSPYGIPSTQWDSAVTAYRGNVTTIKRYEDPIGLSGEIDRHFQYDVAGNLIQADLDCCTSKTWKYDSTTDLAYPTQIVSGASPQLTTNMTYYSDSGLLHTFSDENGQQTTYLYDTMFRLTRVQRPDLVNYDTGYNDTLALEEITNTSPVDSGITAKSVIELDGAGRVKKQTVEDINSTVVSIVDTAYDALGRRTSVSNPYITGTPVYTQFSYDALSRVTKVIPPDGASASNNMQYSYSGNTTTITDPASKQRKNYTDAMGRLVRVDEPGGSVGTGSITITGTENSICDPNGPPPPQCVKLYDIGRVTVTVNGVGKTVSYARTSTASSVATSIRSAFNGDPNSPVTVSGTGATVTFTSVLSGNAANYSFTVSSLTLDPTDFGGPSFSGSPASGSLSGGSDNGTPVSLAHPFATFYTYDVMNSLIQVNQGSQQRNYAYNGLWRLTSAQAPESGTVTYSYQNGGAACSSNPQNVCQRTDARSIVTTYSYDTLNRLTGLSYSDGTPSVTYSYDAGGAPAYALGRLTSMTDGTGSETYTYDQFGRIRTVAKVISGTTYNLGYAYDYIGDLKSLTYPDNSVVNQSYDAVGRLAQISSTGANYLTVPSGSYNAASLPTTLTYGSGVQATIGYNARFQLGALDYKLGATDLLNLTYNYNQTVGGNTVNNGQIQGVTDTRGNAFSTSYTYDALGRLSQGQTLDLTAANTWKLGWVYDRYGNRSQQNLLGGTISVTQPQLSIDPASNRITTGGYQYDAAGNLTADGGVHNYVYDAENRAKSVDSSAATYAYDGKGLRVKKVVGTTTTAYIFSGPKVIAEYTNGTLAAKYVYAGRQLLATVAGSVTYHYPDQLSARLETNATGTVTRTFGHLPFGETWYETGTAIKWKFTSYERDTESGLDYAMFRYDSSRLGRFMTPDLLAGSISAPQSLNRYTYTLNNPVSLTDPLGLAVCPYVVDIDFCGGGAGGDAGAGGDC